MIHIVQLLCPERHCLLGSAYEPEERSFAEIRAYLLTVMRAQGINPHCGICGALLAQCSFEDAVTPYHTIAEAQVPLAHCMAQQMAYRASLDAKGQTFDQQRKN